MHDITSTVTIQSLLDVALEAAWQAGKIALQYFQTDAFDVETKSDLSPVTIADKKAEERIISIINRHFPNHAIIGEESGEHAGTSGTKWIIDPIDGTKSFVQGVPLYGLMIGVEVDGEIVAGVVNMPGLDEMYYASLGNGCFWNGRKAHVSMVKDLSDAVIVVRDERRLRQLPDVHERYHDLCERTKFQRTWGDCYGHLLVATGRAEACLDPEMNLWDNAPLKIILEEAGGLFTDWQGNRTIYGKSAVTSNGILHSQLVKTFNQAIATS